MQIDLPAIDNVKLWDEIVSNKKRLRKSKLLRYRQQVLDRYTFYESHYESLEEILPLDKQFREEIGEELRSCYRDNVALDRTRKILFSAVTKCPYCLLNRANTLDHYFDKSEYPEYSVFTPNLIPCCSECNSHKGAKVFDDKHQRQFVHFYFDNVPDYQYLFVRFTMDTPESIPQVSVCLQFQENEPAERQIRSHYSKLDLLKKYKETIIDRLPVVLETIALEIKSGMPLDVIRKSIGYRHQALINNSLNNYWETSMYAGLLDSEGFLETFCESVM